ncbi:adenylate/guanylate cyclase domain-containing protein [Bradyrhizobium guangdongense]|uniref:AAA family ATPase n=1 Tax=Bradyrhizobium guangdongense TaxID=1325090 RepID=UPI0011267290|nr:AAA family ATPase [Bradyrhizobium guangdongense]TPQ40538.1 adenylate/guanylate cyclase domain-containing protein [Bradyrhizobium guangdongense]
MLDNDPGTMTESGLKDWLEGLGLGQYAELFVQHRVDLDVIPDLTDADLVELGLPLGDRKRLQRGIATLFQAPAAELPVIPVRPPPRAEAAERRQLTTMFCDMVDSTGLSAQFDPEDVRDMIASFRETCVRVVKHYEGFAARYVGDGILVYFGYPTAHEDDAERAVRAGLEIVRVLSSARAIEPRGSISHAPAVRIGIATGLVVVGDLVGPGTEERDSAVGETVNLAARLQGLAPSNGVVISSSTQALLRGKFDYRNLGAHALKGIAEKTQAWHVVRATRNETRFAAAMGSKLTPHVNREEEIALLTARWQQAKDGDGQVVVLFGEPGIGKSRIIQEIFERLGSGRHGHVSFQCSPYYTSTAFYPFIEQLKFSLGLDREDASALSLSSLEAAVAQANVEVEQVTPLFAALLSIPTGDRYQPLELSPQQQKDATVSALVNHLIGLANDQPLVAVFEDLHWIDPTSREVIDLLVDKVQNKPILVVITARSEFQPSWNAHSHITTLVLNRLSRQLRATLVERVAGSRELPKEVVEEIIVKTDGVPLFVEELTKTVLESNLLTERHGRYVLSGPWRQLAIPATLTDSLMARLDRMGPFKKIAQIGATIGREFSYETLQTVADAPTDQIEAALNHLEEAGLIIRRGHPPEALYSFKHVMIQNAAHDSLLHSERRRLHSRIAQVLAQMYPEKTEREPELLAHHLTESGQSEPAASFWLKAGKHAARAGANLEAIGHLRRGLGVVQANARMQGADEMELELRVALGNSLIAAKGYAVQEVEENYIRALELGHQLDDEEKTFAATRGLWVCHFIRADLTRAHDLSVELLKFAKRERLNERALPAQQTGYLIEAHRAIAMTMLYRGRFAASQHHLHRCINLYSPELHSDLMERHGTDPGVVSLSYLGYLLWFLGRPDAARQHSEQAIANAEKIRHPFTLAFALVFGAYLCQHLRDVEGTRDHANRAMIIASEHNFLHWKQQAAILRGWALTQLGEIDEGLSQMRVGLDEYEAMDSWLAGCWFKCLLAEAYAKAGLHDAALRALDGAHAIARRTGDHSYLAEVYRLQGEITLAEGGTSSYRDAEDLFELSLDIARKQNALSWELRTAISLARLWRDGGKREQAAGLLAPVVAKFSEGFRTTDLKQAAHLLDDVEAGQHAAPVK